jgi:formylglycine-generating enzyme required for sulfatase activity/pectate lyase
MPPTRSQLTLLILLMLTAMCSAQQATTAAVDSAASQSAAAPASEPPALVERPIPEAQPGRPLPAFPGAEGFGAYTPGGRGGKVFVVTTLEDYGPGGAVIPGSLRQAVESEGPRIVVFRVGGTIHLKRSLGVHSPYITIAGQTAPGDGICLKGGGLTVFTHDVVVRYLRVRPGDIGGNESDALSVSSGRNIIFDHCSATWSIDEVASTQRAQDITVQWCIIAWPLNRSIHHKGDHALGSLINGIGGISYHHNLYAHCATRCPRPQEEVLLDFRNNVIYDWGSRAGYNVQDPVRLNYMGNYLKPGPSTGRNARQTAFVFGGQPLAYVWGNQLEGLPEADQDNWRMMHPRKLHDLPLREAIGVDQPLPAPPQNTTDAAATYVQVLEQAGCSLPIRDPLDHRLVEEVRQGAGGIIDSQEELGGWPELAAGQAPPDADNDGMPDEWEMRYGLNPTDPSDTGGDADGDGYTHIEEFCNATDPAAAEPVPPAFDLAQVRRQTHQVLQASREIMKERREGMEQQVAEMEDLLMPTMEALPAERVSQLPPRVTLDLGQGVSMDLVLIPAGTFTMGSPPDELDRDDGEPQHEVTISRPFYLAATETTRAQFAAVMGSRPPGESRAALPYDDANWVRAGEFCQRLSEYTGRRLRLPTEAEWEYACRAGATTPFAFGETITTDQANFDGQFAYGDGSAGVRRDRLTPAGSLRPNAWGLYDMHGNAWEWCYDTSHDYANTPVTDPVVAKGERKVIRGGSYSSRPEYLRSASRYSYLTRVGYGFRVVMEAE